MKALTPSQKGALLTILRREPEPTYLSTCNGPSYIASGSAAALEQRGLITLSGAMRYSNDRAQLTDDGRVVATQLDEQVRSDDVGRRDERVPGSEGRTPSTTQGGGGAHVERSEGVPDASKDDDSAQCATRGTST